MDYASTTHITDTGWNDTYRHDRIVLIELFVLTALQHQAMNMGATSKVSAKINCGP